MKPVPFQYISRPACLGLLTLGLAWLMQWPAQGTAQIRLSPRAEMLRGAYHRLERTQSDASVHKQTPPASDPVPEDFAERWHLRRHARGLWMASGLLQIDGSPAVFRAACQAWGGHVRNDEGTTWTVSLPLPVLDSLKSLPCRGYFELDYAMAPLLDSLRISARVDAVHRGTGFSRGLDGSGVVVGIIDIGYDFRHPEFFDSTGLRPRLLRVWDQRADTLNPPAPFGYGQEYGDPNSIQSAETDRSTSSHGTHVAGIAAASGYPSQGHRRGFAPHADLVWVSSDFRSSSVIDAVRYIVRTAKSLGRPCVINMSFGGFVEAMDGTTLYERTLDTLLLTNRGPGVVIVAAAGNSHHRQPHLLMDFGEPRTLHTRPRMVDVEFGAGPRRFTQVSHIGETGHPFEVRIQWMDSSGTPLADSGFLSTRDTAESALTFTLGPDTLNVQYFLTPGLEGNGRPAAFWLLDQNIGAPYLAVLSLRAESGSVHTWNVSLAHGRELYDHLGDDQPLPDFRAGDGQYTTLTPATARELICVGAHTTTTRWRHRDGSERGIWFPAVSGAIAPFSSWGPTLDGRPKPDLTAGGNVVISAMARVNTSVGDFQLAPVYLTETGDTARYYTSSGTSMSAPAVTGTVALMLQATPWLTHREVREILSQTTWQDTHVLSAGPNQPYIWGTGKLDAEAAVRATLERNIPPPVRPREVRVFPMPSPDGWTNVEISGFEGRVTLMLSDMLGRTHRSWVNDLTGSYQLMRLELQGLAPGIYTLRVSDSQAAAFTTLLVPASGYE